MLLAIFWACTGAGDSTKESALDSAVLSFQHGPCDAQEQCVEPLTCMEGYTVAGERYTLCELACDEAAKDCPGEQVCGMEADGIATPHCM